MAACHDSVPELFVSTFVFEDTAIAMFSNSLMPYRCTLKRARKGALAALK